MAVKMPTLFKNKHLAKRLSLPPPANTRNARAVAIHDDPRMGSTPEGLACYRVQCIGRTRESEQAFEYMDGEDAGKRASSRVIFGDL